MKKVMAWILAIAAFAAQAVPVFAVKKDSAETEAAYTESKTDSGRAWITLGDKVKGENMIFFDGGQEDKSSPTYNEKVVIEDVEARKVYGGNYIYARLEENFYDAKNDHEFFVILTFYEFGPDKGTFYFDYPTLDGTKRVAVIKDKNPRWATRSIYIDDAYFNHSIDDVKADIKLISGAYNAFAKIEVVNVKAIKNDNSFSVGTVAGANAQTLSQLGLYPEDYSSIAENEITRADVAVRLVNLIGKSKEAEKYESSLSNADDRQKHALGYLEQQGYINWSGSAMENVSQKELVEIFARLSEISIEGDVFENAINADILKKENLMMQPDKTATEDNFAALGYNWLLKKNKYGKMNIADLMSRDVVDIQSIMKVSDTSIQALAYINPVKIETKKVIDPYTGRTYYYTHKGSNTVREYYTANQWTSDNKRFLVEDENSMFYIYDTEKGTLQFLTVANGTAVGASDKMYYVDPETREVKTMDLNTYEVKVIAKLPSNVSGWWGLSLTNDEKYMAINWTENSSELDLAKPFGGLRQRRAPVLDIENGTWNTEFHKEFKAGESAGMVLNHVIINPVYDNLVFFSHEGTTTAIPDRIWLLDTDTNQAFNLFRQKQVSEDLTGETSGHEMWFGDGNRLGFVKYTYNTNIGYSGLMTIDLSGKHKEYVSNEYRYWHCSASPADDRWMVADTQNLEGGLTEIVLVDRYTGKAYLLCKPQLGLISHPGHAHPSFSPDGKKVSFVMNDGTGIIATAWMDVSDIVDKPAEGGRISVSDTCEVPSYKGCVNYISETEKAGEKCYKINTGNRMLVNVKDNKYQGDRVDAKITFSYYDESFMPIRLTYFGWNPKSTSLDKTEQMKYSINRKNTKKWITKTVELKDINLDNMEFIGTDFRIDGGYADCYIKDVNVEVTNVISDFMDQLPWTRYNKPAEEQKDN